MNDCKV